MKILYLLFAFLFLAFLSERGNAQRRCRRLGGCCHFRRCPSETFNLGQLDCGLLQKCCRWERGK
ncbi:beta-defensin-like [Crotalus adamanteus]|uniref:Beta-defensin-like n=1 Tax=Crotalus adamanteus TaxID=8729 RepID=A0AAW1BRV3_CROAD